MLKFTTRDIFFMVFVASIYFGMRSLSIELSTLAPVVIIAPILITTLVSAAVCWPSASMKRAICTCCAVSFIVATVFFVDCNCFWQLDKIGKLEPISLCIGQFCIGTSFGVMATCTLLNFSDWVLLNVKPIGLALKIMGGTALLGFILGNVNVFLTATPLECATLFSVVGLILGVAWAHWMIGFTTERSQ